MVLSQVSNDGHWVLSSFRQLWLKLLLMFIYKSLCGSSFLHNKYLGVKLLTHKVSVCDFVRIFLFSKWVVMAQLLKNLPAMQETWVQFLGWEDPLEKGMATHSSILAWESHGQRSLAGYSSWDPKELDMTEWLSTAQLKGKFEGTPGSLFCFQTGFPGGRGF